MVITGMRGIMAKFETIYVGGFEPAIYGMRLPLKSHKNMDSSWQNDDYIIGPNDYKLMKSLWKAGSEHRKYLRQIQVWVNISAPRYFWTEWDTYKIGTTANSESTMHKIQDEDFQYQDFEFPWGLDEDCDDVFKNYIDALRDLVQYRLKDSAEGWYKKQYKEALKAMLPEGFIQKRTINLNYEVLANMYHQRKNHALPQWNTDFTEWVHTLPYYEFITGEWANERSN